MWRSIDNPIRFYDTRRSIGLSDMRLFKAQYVISYIINTHTRVEVLYIRGVAKRWRSFSNISTVLWRIPCVNTFASGWWRMVDPDKLMVGNHGGPTVERLCFKWGSNQQVIGVVFVGKSSNKKLMNPETPQDAMFELWWLLVAGNPAWRFSGSSINEGF